MAEAKKSLFSRIMEGREKDENYARSTLPQNRWQLFWDIMKGRIGKVCIVNLLMLLFFLPVIALVVMRYVNVLTVGTVGPYAAAIGMGYPAYPNVSGVWEYNLYMLNVLYFGGIVIASIVAAVGLAGGIYVIRNMIWTEGIFVANDFWRGVKLNFGNALEAALFFSIFLFLDVFINSLAAYYLSIGVGNAVFFTIARVVAIIVNVFAGLMSLWMLSLGVTYKQSPWELIRNAFVMTIGTFPQTVFFAAVAILPLFLILTRVSLLMAVGILFYLFLGFSYLLLSWMSFTQWAFDKFVNPGMKGAKVGRGLYNPSAPKTENDAVGEAAALRAYKLAIIAQGKSNLMSRPMKPIDDDLTVYELPESFSREDLEKLKQSKSAIQESQNAYEEEHKNDDKYVEYNKQFEEREKALQPETDKKGKIKKKAAPKMLNEK